MNTNAQPIWARKIHPAVPVVLVLGAVMGVYIAAQWSEAAAERVRFSAELINRRGEAAARTQEAVRQAKIAQEQAIWQLHQLQIWQLQSGR